jgi:hypothetical protein
MMEDIQDYANDMADIAKAVKNDKKDEAIFLLNKLGQEIGGEVQHRIEVAMFAK